MQEGLSFQGKRRKNGGDKNEATQAYQMEQTMKWRSIWVKKGVKEDSILNKRGVRG